MQDDSFELIKADLVLVPSIYIRPTIYDNILALAVLDAEIPEITVWLTVQLPLLQGVQSCRELMATWNK
jgi:hypothetical protein